MLGRYKIIEALGEGGMATVYKGFDTTLQRYVAIKVIKSDMEKDVNFRKRFDREARALAQLSHPHIVHINDFGEQGGTAFLVMDYIAGGTLKSKMGKPMPYQEAARLLLPIAQALGFAHSRKIVHRDIKPANILLTDTGIPMLSDFGIAKMLETSHETIELTSSTGTCVGTPAYMAPEQTGAHFDHRADIYSLGIVFYELVTGKRPYDADTPLATLMKHAGEPLPSPRSFVSSLPDSVEQVIYKALSKNPDERFQNMDEFARQLEQLQYGNLETTFARAPQPGPLTKTQQSTKQTYRGGNQSTGKSSVGKWVAVILAIFALGLIGLIALIGGAYYFWPQISGVSQAPITQTAEALGKEITALAGEWGTVTAQVKGTTLVMDEAARQTGEAAGLATQKAVTLTQAVSSSTQKAESTAAGAEAQKTALAQNRSDLLKQTRVAFFNDSDIWVTGIDGKYLTQLTTNGGDKRNLRWSSDGKTVYYISGKCVYSIDIINKTENKLVCFSYVQKLSGFEISPDGKYAGILADDNLYVGPYNLDSLKKMMVKAALSDFATCNYFSGVRYFHLLGDNSQVVVVAFAPGEDAVRIHNQGCISHNAAKWDEFPAERFRPYKFNDSPTVYEFAWNGLREFAMVTNFSQKSLGYLYLYHNELRSGEQSKPLGSDCCYSSPSFSYNGSYLTFGYINLENINTANMTLYAIPYTDLGTGNQFKPLALPEDMLKGSSARPQPVIFDPIEP